MVYTDGEALVADTIEELQAFATKAGVFVFNDHRRRPHFILDKYSLPTVLAHGAKRVKTSDLVKKSQAMAKKREQWYLEATDDQIRERVRLYAPFPPGDAIYYEGKEFTQEEMFDVYSQMFIDMRENPSKAADYPKMYKLPSVLPLQPRKDPPTDRERLADLYNLIEEGKRRVREEEAKPEHDPNAAATQDAKMIRDQKRIDDINGRIKGLQEEYDVLEVKVRKAAIADLDVKYEAAMKHLETFEIKTGEDFTKVRTLWLNLQQQLEELRTMLADAEKRVEASIAEKEQVEQPAEENPVQDFLDNGPVVAFEGENPGDPYKVVYDPASPKEGESVGEVDVTKKWPSQEALDSIEETMDKKSDYAPEDNMNLLSGTSPFPVDKIEERLKQLEEAQATGIPLPGYGWFGKDMVTLSTLELLDKEVRRLLYGFTFGDFLEKYNAEVPIEDQHIILQAPQDTRDSFRQSILKDCIFQGSNDSVSDTKPE